MKSRFLMAPPPNSDKKIRKARIDLYPKEVWYFLACFICLLGLLHAISLIHSIYARRKRNNIGGADPEARSSALSSKIHLRRIPLAFVNTYRIVALRWTVHLDIGTRYTLNVAEVAVTCAYIIAIFTWAFINTTTVEGQKLNILYWANRCGVIAASQFPLITALGTNNNIISLITGVGYVKLNFVHRMASRVVFVLIWVHAAARLKLEIDPGDWEAAWLRCGLMAGVSLTAMLLASLRPVRARAYELFFWVHAMTALVILVGAYIHTHNFLFHQYIWPCFVIWGLDRLMRGLRVLYFFYSPSTTESPDPDPEKPHLPCFATSVQIEAVTPTVMSLTIPCPRHFHWSAGQSAFLSIPEVSKFLHESHPFTIASIDRKSDAAALDADEKASEEAGRSDELVFFINVHSGFTKRLAAHNAVDTSGRITTLTSRVYVDGPYGSAPDLRAFDTCVLVAGGSGISYTLPLLLDAIRNVKNQTSVCQRVVFVWAIRDIHHTALVQRALIPALSSLPVNLTVDIRIHVTGAHVTTSDSVKQSAASSSTSIQKSDALLGLAAVTLREGRPDISAVMKEEAEATRGGRMGACVCGSASLVQSTRSAVGLDVAGPTAVMKGGASVSLFIEVFGYV